MAVWTDYGLTKYQPSVPSLALLWETLKLWRRRAQERNELARMDERTLHDIGLSRSAIYAELHKPFWRG
ncbi:MAG TPA: DUF1127 domain-containing protein [Stellaceae bacterium]|nr:DUF1127 domain-containing protein [Stellaceae bacterium]